MPDTQTIRRRNLPMILLALAPAMLLEAEGFLSERLERTSVA